MSFVLSNLRIWKAFGFLTTFDHNFDQNGEERLALRALPLPQNSPQARFRILSLRPTKEGSICSLLLLLTNYVSNRNKN